MEAAKESLLLVAPGVLCTKVCSSLGLAPEVPNRIAPFSVLTWHMALPLWSQAGPGCCPGSCPGFPLYWDN